MIGETLSRRLVFDELRTYWRVIRRRWPFVVLPTLIVFALSLLTLRPTPPEYTVNMNYLVSQEPSPSAAVSERERQFSWVTSQYVVNSITDWVRHSDFSTRVAERLQVRGVEVDPIYLTEHLGAGTIRSLLEIEVTYHDPEVLEQIAVAVTDVLQQDNLEALPHLGDVPAQIEPVDRIMVMEKPADNDWIFGVPLRLVVAVALGLFLALLVEYFDPKIYTRAQVQDINLPLVGEIPTD